MSDLPYTVEARFDSYVLLYEQQTVQAFPLSLGEHARNLCYLLNQAHQARWATSMEKRENLP